MSERCKTFEELAAALRRRFGVAGTADTAGLPPEPGAYLLLLALPTETSLDVATLPSQTLSPGPYLYAGSAHGSGGLRARLARHLRRKKKPHWHIDRLTVAAEMVLAFPFPSASHTPVSPRPPSRGPVPEHRLAQTGSRLSGAMRLVRDDTNSERIDTITECTLVETLLESGRYHHPLPGFGSSDCRTCASHLLAPN